MLPGPVFQAELTSIARRKRSYVLRVVYGALILFIIWCNQPAFYLGRVDSSNMSIQETARMASGIAVSFMVTQAMTILVLTPSLVAGVIADEKRRKTLDYLLASRLSSAEIVLGKLFARLLLLLVFVAIGLPILTLLSLFGGVSPDDVVVFTAACASTAFFLAALSIAVSLHAKKPTDAVGQAYSLGFFWLFGPSIVRFVLPQYGNYGALIYEYVRPVNEWLGASSPWFVTISQMGVFWSGTSYQETIFWMIGLQVGYGILLATYSVVRLRPIYRKDRSMSPRRGLGRFLPRRRLIPRRGCGDDAMLWKECLVSRGARSTRVFSVLLFLLLGAYVVYLVVDFGKPALIELWNQGYGGEAGEMSARAQFNMMTRAMGGVVFCTMILAVASAASSSVTAEREGDTWLSLTATPLDAAEIVRGKILGAVWAARWLAAVWLLLVLVAVLLGAVHPLGLLAALIVVAVDVWFAGALGVYFSLKSKSSMKALMATNSTMLFLNGVYLLFTIPIDGLSVLRYVGVMPFTEFMALFSWGELTGSAWSSPGYSRFDFFFTGLCSVVLYAVAAFLLTARLLSGFDDMIDRPHGSPRSRGGPPKPLGIEFLDEVVPETAREPVAPEESAREL